jgi:ATP adenylyltransferase
VKRDILWAPWRIGYISDTNKQDSECFLCHHHAHPDQDNENLVVWRSSRCVVVMNRYPYNNGHLLIAPQRHIADLCEATEEELLDLMCQIKDVQSCLSQTIRPDGFNIGININRCAGAGLPGHLHVHVVPRWDGDTNFMNVCSETDVISQSMVELLKRLKQTAKENNLPKSNA